MKEKKSKKTYLLGDLEVFEVSLVRKPANGRSFYLTKTADLGSEKMEDEKFLAILDTPAENENKLDDVISKMEMSEDAVRAVRAALRLLDAFKDEIPSDTLAGLADAAGMDHHMEEMRHDMEDDMDKEKMYRRRMKQEEEDVLKSADIPAELRPALERLWKSNEEHAARVSELESVLKGERDLRLLNAETERVSKSFSHVPGMESQTLAQMLVNLRKASPESADQVESLLAATEAAMVAKETGSFEEAGTTTPTQSAHSNAWGKIEAMAADLVKKSEASDQHSAIDTVLTRNPELYAAYLAEKN